MRRDVIEYDVRSLVSFTEKARAAGKKLSTELLTFGKLGRLNGPVLGPRSRERGGQEQNQQEEWSHEIHDLGP